MKCCERGANLYLLCINQKEADELVKLLVKNHKIAEGLNIKIREITLLYFIEIINSDFD